MQISDTHSEMGNIHIQLLRMASPSDKMGMLIELISSARILALAGLRSRYPNASEALLQRKLSGLLLGEETSKTVYGIINDIA